MLQSIICCLFRILYALSPNLSHHDSELFVAHRYDESSFLQFCCVTPSPGYHQGFHNRCLVSPPSYCNSPGYSRARLYAHCSWLAGPPLEYMFRVSGEQDCPGAPLAPMCHKSVAPTTKMFGEGTTGSAAVTNVSFLEFYMEDHKTIRKNICDGRTPRSMTAVFCVLFTCVSFYSDLPELPGTFVHARSVIRKIYFVCSELISLTIDIDLRVTYCCALASHFTLVRKKPKPNRFKPHCRYDSVR